CRRHQRITRLQTRLHSVEYIALDQGRHRHDGDLALRLYLSVFMRACVEPVFADIGGPGEDGVDLRQAPFPTVAGEEATLIEIGSNSLDAHRARRAVTFEI